MNIENLLNSYKSGDLSLEQAEDILKKLPYEDIGFAKIDHHRKVRNGFPEVIFCPGKTDGQIAAIAGKLLENGGSNLLASRATRENYEAVKSVASDAVYYESARTVEVRRAEPAAGKHTVAIIAAGTSDLPVAEEAAVTAEAMGNRIDRIYDVGVAGIHRLFAQLERIESSGIIIVTAGMEGALASVVGGLVDKPVIAVPTSIGYGASFGGLAALLSMLNSCASGVCVCNIDNGFGAACTASRINHMN